MKKILAVDDSKDNLYYLKTLLEANGYEIVLASDGANALDKLAHSDFDLIISDILMPVMDGFMFCHECGKSEHLREIPFVFYTATYTDEMDEELALKLGAATFIRKPIEPELFLETIKRIMLEGNPKLHISQGPDIKERELLKLYSESLIHKLEKKNLELQQEIAEREKTETTLSIAEKSFKTIFEQAAIGVAEIETGTSKFLKVNSRYCEIVGYSAEELKELTFKDYTHPDDIALDLENMSRITREEIRDFSMEKRYIRKNGEIVWVTLTVSPTWNPGEEKTTHIATIHDITAQKIAEAELKASEAHLRTVLEYAPESVELLGKDGVVLEINPAGLAMIEADSLEEVVGKSLISSVKPEYRDGLSEMNRRVLSGEHGKFEFEIITLKGTHRWLEANAAPMRDAAGKIFAILAITRDISERKRFAATLAESEDRYRDLVENSPVIMMTHDFEGNFLSANKTAMNALGYSYEELKTLNLRELLLPEFQKEIDEYHKELKKNGFARGKSRFVTKSGEHRIWEFANTVRTEGVDKPVIRGMATDITDRIKAERALKHSERDYRTIFEQAHDAIIVIEPNGEIVLDVNERACEIYGFSREEFIGMSLETITKDVSAGRKKITETLKGGEFLHFETTQFRKDGTPMRLEVNASKIEYKNQPALISINRDITERKEAESIITSQKRILEMVAIGAPLKETLDSLLEGIESVSPEMLCAILLLNDDGIHLQSYSAPSLPPEYFASIDGKRIGEGEGSCGTAAFRKENVISEDIETDPLWAGFRDSALKFGLRACWSSPILDPEGKVLGTFAIYYRKPARPTEKHLRLIELATGTAAIAIARFKSEDALRTSERRLNEAQAAAQIGDWEYCLTTGRVSWSESMYEIYERDPRLGTPTYAEQLAFYVTVDSERLHELVQRAALTGEEYRLDLGCELPSGTKKFISAVGKSIKDEDGNVIRLYGIAQDITERKSAEESIRFQAHLLDTVQQSVVATDTRGKIVYWNQYATHLTSFSADEVIGKDIFEIMFPEFSHATREKVMSRLISGGSWDGEHVFKTHSGKEFYAHIFNSPVTDENGEVIGFLGITIDITDRKRSEMALQESEERLRTLFEQMVDGFYYSSDEGKLLQINPAMAKMFGYASTDEMMGVDIANDLYFEPVDRDSRNLEQGVEKPDVYRMRRKDGTEIWVEDNGRHICDEHGNVLFHEGVLRDVTERVISDRTLRETMERLDLSQQVAKVGTFEWDIKESLVYWSTSMEELFGMNHGEFRGGYATWKTFVHPEDLHNTKNSIRIALESGGIYDEYRIILPDGSIKWLHARAKVFFDESGEPLRMVGVHLDVTERKEAEETIAEANVRAIREYENLLDILSKLAQTVGSARDINAIFSAIVKFTSDRVPCDRLIISLWEKNEKRKPVYFWNSGQVRDVSEVAEIQNLEPLVETAVSRGEVAISNLPVGNDGPRLSGFAKDTARPEISGSALVAPMKFKGEVVGVIEVQSNEPDVFQNEHRTAMRMAANLVANSIENVRLVELEQQRAEQLQRSQKLESVGRLAGGIAHDFNNMLTAINGYSELVLKRLSDDDPIRNNIIEIKKAGERSADLTRQLLAFSRKQVLQLKVLNLNDIVSETMLMLERLIGEDLQLKTELNPDLGLIESDPGQLSQVIINLAVNARDAMPNGGVLELQTSNISLENDTDQNPSLPPSGSYVLISVSDTGVGMEKETLENIFEPFFTTKKVGKGTGLGLATVYGIVRQSKGYIFVDSSLNEGTTFRVYFPRADENQAKSRLQNISPSIKRGSETILIVEDEAMVRSLTRQVLEECGYTVYEAGNGIEALNVCESINFEIDMVLTDVVMPKMGGRELGDKLRQLRSELPILFTSGYADDAELRDYIGESQSNFIAKPFTFEELAVKVRDFLDSKNRGRHLD